jgi:ubiquinone/menaquinone biosynthesis C-methylase UbiE
MERGWRRTAAVAVAAVLCCAPSWAQTAAADAVALERRLADAEARKDWPAAVEAATLLNEHAEQQHLEALYRLARLQALAGHRDQALEWLERVHQAGLFGVQRVRRDEAFSALRDDPRFRSVTQAIWMKGYLWLLERPERDAYQQPERVMEVLAFRQGERVADIGAGSGYFTRRISRAIGPAGTVWALDIRPEILQVLDERTKQEGLTNVRTRQVAADDPALPQGGVDTVVMVDTLHYIKDRGAYARKLRTGLAPGGRVVIIDFRPKPIAERPWGPPPEQNMSREEVDAAMAEAGLFPSRVHDFLTEQFFVEYRARPER